MLFDCYYFQTEGFRDFLVGDAMSQVSSYVFFPRRKCFDRRSLLPHALSTLAGVDHPPGLARIKDGTFQALHVPKATAPDGCGLGMEFSQPCF